VFLESPSDEFDIVASDSNDVEDISSIDENITINVCAVEPILALSDSESEGGEFEFAPMKVPKLSTIVPYARKSLLSNIR